MAPITSRNQLTADCGTTCTGIYSSGGAGGGIVIVHTGSVAGTGTITSNGQSTLSTVNDSTGGAGRAAPFYFSPTVVAWTVLPSAPTVVSGGNAWPKRLPVAFLDSATVQAEAVVAASFFSPAPLRASSVAGGSNGYTDTVQDSYGATPGQPGFVVTTNVITETPGTQPGAYCAGADLAVTNSGSPSIVLPGANITYTQTVTNNGPFDAINAVFSEGIPANTIFESINTVPGWNCVTPAVGGTGTITCSDPDFANTGSVTFTVVVQVGNGTTSGTQIVDVDNITSGTTDPNLANNTAIAINSVGTATQADLGVTNTPSSPSVAPGSNFTMTAVVTNHGPATASALVFSEPTASNEAGTPTTGTTAGTYNATFVSLAPPSGWTCTTPTPGTTGTITCSTGVLCS